MAVATKKPAGKTAAAPARKRASKPKGLTIPRVFTTEGVHPYDTVEWELRDVVQTNWKTGATVFEQAGVEFPKSWSVNASTIATTKYFRGALGTEQRERSLKQLIDRVADTYTTEGARAGYFATDADVEIFNHELKYALLHQMFAFNSPVWFNVGTASVPQVSACFILGVEDSMESILNWYTEEGFIFKGGSGAGVNLSNLRSSKELLSSGGAASGPVSFMRGADASAGTIKSGGACLAPWTMVYTTENGPVSVKDLAESGEQFTAISYNPLLGRMQATRGTAFLSGHKQLVRLTTDKGVFTMSADHPVMLMSGGYKPVGKLTPGMSIRPGCVTVNGRGVQRVGLQDGTKSKLEVHRLVAMDLMGADIDGFEVHHKDKNPANNAVSNLEVMTRHDHISEHMTEALDDGTHPFLKFHGLGNHPQVAGDANGMSTASGNRTEEYRANQVAAMHRNDVYRLGQDAAARQRMLNKAYEVVNNGGSIETFEDYCQGRRQIAKLGYSKAQILDSIESRFGSYDEFVAEVRANNHRVVSVEALDFSDVYDVEIISGTPEDRSEADGHNFMIISETHEEGSCTGIMVHNTRRAAKMVVLDVDHPDIEEFVETKAREEDKIRALRDAGFDMDLGGADIVSVQYQNANNSVRVDDAFMKAVEAGSTYDLLARKDGSVVETVDARALFTKIAEAAWECADPGIQYKDTINDWHTLSALSPITASNPCSEFMSIDNSSCNLASINLMKFLNEDGSFDVENFEKLVELAIVAMDISVAFGHFPTEKIGDNTRKYRQLGIGYANLGALLMATGHGYDSDGGRDLAAAITSLMAATAHVQSARIAKVVGAYHDWKTHAPAHTRVVKMHRDAAMGVAPLTGPANKVANDLSARAFDLWTTAVSMTEQTGLRNSQLTLLAPTGTIGFLMDCDTTGIEPDFALVKFKKLVGGSSMQIVNQTVELALDRLGYDEATSKQIVAHIAANGNVVGAPGLKTEHYEVFDCAVGNPRSISAMGHVKMMAAVQPFLSGAISKTVNLPEEATVTDIADVYMQGWKLGLKALAIYRDNCKVGQPLSSGDKATESGSKAAAQTVVVQTVEKEKIVYRPKRTRLPRKRNSSTTSFQVGGAEGYLTAGEYDDGRLGELFLKFGKQGSTLAGVMDAFSIAISVALQYGVPLETFVAKFTNQKFEPAGMTDDPDIKISSSLMDYVFRRLALDHMSFEERSEFGVYTAEERKRYVETGSYELTDEESAALREDDLTSTPHEDSWNEDDESDIPAVSFTSRSVTVSSEAGSVEEKSTEVHSSADLAEKMLGKASDAPLCMTCGTKMQRAGSCYVCEGCGSTSGCS